MFNESTKSPPDTEQKRGFFSALWAAWVEFDLTETLKGHVENLETAVFFVDDIKPHLQKIEEFLTSNPNIYLEVKKWDVVLKQAESLEDKTLYATLVLKCVEQQGYDFAFAKAKSFDMYPVFMLAAKCNPTVLERLLREGFNVVDAFSRDNKSFFALCPKEVNERESFSKMLQEVIKYHTNAGRNWELGFLSADIEENIVAAEKELKPIQKARPHATLNELLRYINLPKLIVNYSESADETQVFAGALEKILQQQMKDPILYKLERIIKTTFSPLEEKTKEIIDEYILRFKALIPYAELNLFLNDCDCISETELSSKESETQLFTRGLERFWQAQKQKPDINELKKIIETDFHVLETDTQTTILEYRSRFKACIPYLIFNSYLEKAEKITEIEPKTEEQKKEIFTTALDNVLKNFLKCNRFEKFKEENFFSENIQKIVAEACEDFQVYIEFFENKYRLEPHINNKNLFKKLDSPKINIKYLEIFFKYYIFHSQHTSFRDKSNISLFDRLVYKMIEVGSPAALIRIKFYIENYLNELQKSYPNVDQENAELCKMAKSEIDERLIIVAAENFCLVVLFTDGYFKLVTAPETALKNITDFFTITASLPFEIQSKICNFTAGRNVVFVKTDVFGHAYKNFKNNQGGFAPIPSSPPPQNAP